MKESAVGRLVQGSSFGQAFWETQKPDCCDNTEERRGVTLKRVNWVLVLLVLIGFVIGGFIGTYFDGTFLNYGQVFGLNNPVELDLGFIILTFGLKFHITIASVVGVIISFVVYRFIR